MGVHFMNFDMRTSILFFCLFSISLSATDIELFSPKDRTACCLTATNQCATRCAGRSCSSTSSVRCGILNSSCGTVTCSSVASSTCVAATATAPATSPVAAPTTTCAAAGEQCMTSGSTAQTACCTGTDCFPFGTSGNAYCINTGG